MTSKQIALTYLASNIESPESIFKDANVFRSILPWAKDSARELFETQRTKMFLSSYIDDIAPIVDEYLIKRASKMYLKTIKSQNKLSSTHQTVSWLIDRWINMFINLTTNTKYKDYIDITKIKLPFSDDANITDNNNDNINIEMILEFEKLQKLPDQKIKDALKTVWEDSKFDLDFDYYDLNYLCNKFGFNIDEIIVDTINSLKFKKVQTESGNSQLVFEFM